jgi:hypothetical protein
MTMGPADQARYDVLRREVERERAACARLQAELHQAQAEAHKLRAALGLAHQAAPKAPRNFGGGDG